MSPVVDVIIIVLLERPYKENAGRLQPLWGIGSDGYVRAEKRHRREDLKLAGLGISEIYQIIHAYSQTVALPGEEEAWQMLRGIDTECRPLYAAMLGDALGAGRNPRHWDKEALVRDVLERSEEKLWKPTGVTQEDEDILALVTLCAGASLEGLRKALSSERWAKIDGGFLQRYEVMAKRLANKLEPLQPDIIGELFVLEHLQPPESAITDRTDWARETAWQIPDVKTSDFLLRAAQPRSSHASPSGENPAANGCPS